MRQVRRKKRKDGIQRQEQIMAIALALFADKGYHATSVDDILKTAGIAKGTFYLHFKSKQGLLAMLIDKYFNIIIHSARLMADSMSKPIDELMAFSIDVARSINNIPEVNQFTKVILAEFMGLDEPFMEKINAFIDEGIAMATGYIEKAQASGIVSPQIDPYFTAINIWGGSKEILFRKTVLEDDFDIDKAIISTINFYIFGLFVQKQSSDNKTE
jgi:AcrR family transcriptional regulator